MLKRFLCMVLTVGFLFGFMPGNAEAVSTSATAAILVDVDSGRVLYEQNADRKMLIASTTKILTALVAIREGNLSDRVIVSRKAAYTEGSSMYLKEGEALTLETLLYGLLLCSGNDAAVAIAEHVGGSEKRFVQMMNALAKELGMVNSSFANPNGLDDEAHFSTARDMSKLACVAVNDPTLVRIASTRSVSIGGRTMTNHNKLLNYMSNCIGLKTGFTKAAGRTLVSCAERNGQRLVAVTLQDGNDWADHEALFTYGFETFPAQRFANLGSVVEEAAIQGGIYANVPLVASNRFSWPIKAGEVVKAKIDLQEPLRAPLLAGTQVGTAIYELNGSEIGRVELLCGKTVLPKISSALTTLKTGLT